MTAVYGQHEYGQVDDCTRCVWCECLPGAADPCLSNPINEQSEPNEEWDTCIEWSGSKFNSGYGRVWYEGRSWRVHRLAWIQAWGPIPDELLVLHHCDNRACYNLDHLWLGTHADNMRDMVEKGRHSQQRKTHCPQGHEYTEGNVYVSTNWNGRPSRKCATCCRAQVAAYRAKVRAR